MATRWQPFGEMRTEMERLQNEMNRLFGRFGWGDETRPALTTAYPALDIWEDDDCLYAETELPGMELQDLDIYVTGGNQLAIKGERKRPAMEKGTWLRQERGFGSFQRVFVLPVEVDADKVEATLVNGVLTLQLPKQERAKPRRIQVKVE